MCTTKRNSKRSQVWQRFLELREAGRQPILMDSSDGWSYVCVPAEVQSDRVDFLESSLGGHPPQDNGPAFIGGWLGFVTYNWGLEQMGIESKHVSQLPVQWWRYCEEVYAFEVKEEDGETSRATQFLGESVGFSLKNLQSGISYEEYESKIGQIHQLLRDGEIYQVNFAQEFKADFEGDPFALYRALFVKNPSAMCFYAEDEDWAVLSNSPERLVSLKGGVLRAEPVKGTVAHDDDPQFLLNDEKSYAELTMIVDLLRNDLGRVSKLGTVEVLKHQALMELTNVWHTYSVIQAQFDESFAVSDLLRAVFPGGSITGCPKKRSMQTIDRLENFSRGAYCGSAGYVSLNGNIDFNIMIRTGTVKQGRLSFPVGGGIVMDSTAESEYEECFQKLAILESLVSAA